MSNNGITPDKAVNMLRAESETGAEEFMRGLKSRNRRFLKRKNWTA